MSREQAQLTLEVIEKGEYTAPSGARRCFASDQHAASAGTVLYLPEQAATLLGGDEPVPISGCSSQIEVTPETTQQAALRLAREEDHPRIGVLNFASARNPGGGFVRGARAQEEDLCRCSGLYPCLLTQRAYYEANRAQRSMLYTDHVICSPDVPWFRVRRSEFLEEPFLAGVITAPAPNAGEYLRRHAGRKSAVHSVLRRRAGIVLAVARKHQMSSLVLGAWGCGVFKNDPAVVASAFSDWLHDARFVSCFHRIVFAIYGRDESNLRAFAYQFSPTDETGHRESTTAIRHDDL